MINQVICYVLQIWEYSIHPWERFPAVTFIYELPWLWSYLIVIETPTGDDGDNDTWKVFQIFKGSIVALIGSIRVATCTAQTSHLLYWLVIKLHFAEYFIKLSRRQQLPDHSVERLQLNFFHLLLCFPGNIRISREISIFRSFAV